MRKSKKMRQLEHEHGLPMEELLPAMLEQGDIMDDAARALGVSKATIGVWMLKLGIRYERVVLGPGEVVAVLQPDDQVAIGALSAK